MSDEDVAYWANKPLDEWNRVEVTLANEVLVLRRLVQDLRHDDPCGLDHHGNCQEHNWFGESECPHARAARLFR